MVATSQRRKEKINKALEINNSDSNALYRLGACYYKEKNYEKILENDKLKKYINEDIQLYFYLYIYYKSFEKDFWLNRKKAREWNCGFQVAILCERM